MTRWLKCLWLALALAPFGCAQPPTFNQVSGALPPLSAGDARIFVYRPYEPYESLSWVAVFFNGRNVGAVGPGHVLMRDVPAGTYDIAPGGQGLYPNQDKVVQVAPGQTVYAKIESFKSPDTSTNFNRQPVVPTFVVVLQDTPTGRREIGNLWYTAAAKRPATSS